jgi:histidinol-phosphate aminotransferase
MSEEFNADNLIVSWVKELSPYVPGEQPQSQGWVKLNTNENPYPASANIAKVLQEQVEALRLYPEPTSLELRKAIAKQFDLSAEQVIIGNGSDNILDMITRSFVGLGQAGHTVPSYSLYPVVVAMSGGDLLNIPFEEAMELPVEAIAKTPASVFFLTNPNAPTGVCFSLESIKAVLKKIKGILVVDEAYIDFGGQSASALLQSHNNLIVVQTFSKSYSLAGLRVGYAMASSKIIQVLDSVRDAYNVDRLAQAIAQVALEDRAHFQANCEKIIQTRNQSQAYFQSLDWFTYPSSANFLFTQPKNAQGESGPEVAASLFEYLKSKKILVRYFGSHPLTCSFLRVSIGTDNQMKTFNEGIESWLKQEQQN